MGEKGEGVSKIKEDELKRKEYSQTFEAFWQSLENYFPKGSKAEAYREFQKLECNQEDAEFIASRYNELVNAKKAVMERGGWAAPTKHLCRYLKGEEFDDEISERIDTGRTKDEERRRQYAEFFLGPEADMGQSLGHAGGEQTGDRASNVIDFPILDEPSNT